MRNTLLTTTALVLSAGIASADGHATITWSGTATAGLARQGETIGVTKGNTVLNLAHLSLDFDAAMDLSAAHSAVTTAAAATEAVIRAAITLQISRLAEASNITPLNATSHAAADAALDVIVGKLDALATLDTAAVKTADFETYSEVNATVTGVVAMDNGMSMSASMSVDAGTGYDFADDDSFDAAKGGATLDNVTLNAGSLGTFKLDQNAVVHLVDADDDTNADILYTNTFGSLTVSGAIDVSTDVDDNAVKGAVAVVAVSAGSASAASITLTTAAVTAVAADVQWSAKVSMPVSGGTAYVALDEEGGSVFGASTTVGGIGLSFNSKLEALGEGLSEDRSNTIGLTYVMGEVTAGASWNSVEDGDQWGISAAYAGADGMSISASTDEGSDWSISGSYAMGTGASVVGGVNYTEDAYLGLSFAF